MKKLASRLIPVALLGSASSVLAHPGHDEGVHSYLHAEHLVIIAGLAVAVWIANRIYKSINKDD